MKILSIDTTTLLRSIALSNDEKPVAEKTLDINADRTERLIELIDAMLDECSWKKRDIEAVCVAIGPGSFTGLRVGLGVAKGIAVGLDIPICGVSSLLSLAHNGSRSNDLVIPMIDARRGEIYSAAFKFSKDGRYERVMDECVLPPNALFEKLRELGKRLLILGDGAVSYRDEIARSLSGVAVLADDEKISVRAHNLATVSLKRLRTGDSDDVSKLAPNYIRHSDAEIGFLGRGNK